MPASITAHGGSVTADSPGPGKGATFVVRLPRVRDEASRPEPARSLPPPSPRQIVLVDDNADARNALADQLRAAGHSVTTAVDGPGGVETIQNLKPDIAIVGTSGCPGSTAWRSRGGCGARPKSTASC
jgi:hypothetical protein